MVPLTMKGHHIMGNNDKAASSKTTANEPSKTTTNPEKMVTMVPAVVPVKPGDAATTAIAPKEGEAGKVDAGANKSASNAIETPSAAAKQEDDSKKKDETQNAGKRAGPSAPDSRTKMEVATEIYRRMKKEKNVTRKEIVEQFVAEAKLSKAGASTYFQLIKAKVG